MYKKLGWEFKIIEDKSIIAIFEYLYNDIFGRDSDFMSEECKNNKEKQKIEFVNFLNGAKTNVVDKKNFNNNKNSPYIPSSTSKGKGNSKIELEKIQRYDLAILEENIIFDDDVIRTLSSYYNDNLTKKRR